MSAADHTDPLALVISRLESRGCQGHNHDYHCPAHKDDSASLRIARLDATTARSPDTVGNVVLHCHAGCSTAAVLDALGLKYLDLLAPENRGRAAQEAKRPDLADIEARFKRGELIPNQVLGAIPEGLTQWEREMAEELAYLLGLFDAAGEKRPMPGSCRHMARRCGWFNSHGEPLRIRASNALAKLDAVGYIRDAGALKPRPPQKRGTNLWAPPFKLPPDTPDELPQLDDSDRHDDDPDPLDPELYADPEGEQ